MMMWRNECHPVDSSFVPVPALHCAVEMICSPSTQNIAQSSQFAVNDQLPAAPSST